MKSIPLLSRDCEAIVDDSDFGIVNQFKWTVCKNRPTSSNRYARTTIGGRCIYMHRLISGAARGVVVDHINGDGLDNRRSNLRICTISQNVQNSKKSAAGRHSRFKGVSLDSYTGRWLAYITANRRRYNLGRFDTEILAAEARDSAALKMHGEFAVLNRSLFPQEHWSALSSDF